VLIDRASRCLLLIYLELINKPVYVSTEYFLSSSNFLLQLLSDRTSTPSRYIDVTPLSFVVIVVVAPSRVTPFNV
jgi:hypothetical protein